MNKKEMKEKMLEILSTERTISNKRRLETICRSQINRLSYTMILGDRCIYLEKDGRKIFIESRCRELGDGYSRPAYITAYNESKKIIDQLMVWYEETIHTDQQAV
jgi:hypothetical protein